MLVIHSRLELDALYKDKKSIVIIALNTRRSIACYRIRIDQETIQVSHLGLLLDKHVACMFTFIP